ncbi:MAG: DeoR family transcriptional regulator [Rhodoglobus sp.]|nr:DeoR family transcriptional regulator [Rhodoglobus sp.]
MRAQQSRVGRNSASEVLARQMAILEEIRKGNGGIELLSEQFEVSPATIRRDLEQLARSGQITRTYGGAVVQPAAEEPPFREREHINRPQKMALARAAAERVAEGDLIILDGGSTTGHIATQLRGMPIVAVTIGLNALLTLYDALPTEVIVLGGSFREQTKSMLGPIAVENLRRFSPDRVFVSAAGVTAGGLHSPTLQQAQLKAEMLRVSRESFVVVDATKINVSALPYLTPLDSPVTIITDDRVTQEQVDALRTNPCIEVQIVSA